MILVLAGTSEARKVCAGLSDRGVPVLASLSGATRAPKSIGVETRVGGFGGREQQASFLRHNNVTAVIDASHPFAASISKRSHDICRELDLPYLHLLRREWSPIAGDQWTQIDSGEEAADFIPPNATVFLGTGRQTLDEFSNLAGRDVICRQIDPPEAAFPFEGGRYLVGRPPFSVADETTLFRDLGVDVLVVKNAGGAASATKLTAARALGIPVLMIRRPAPPNGAKIVETPEEAIKWEMELA